MPKNFQTKKSADNAAAYKITAALVLLCVGLVILRRLNAYYGTIGGMKIIPHLLPGFIIAGFGAAVAGIAALLVVKNKIVRQILPWVILVAAMTGVTAVSMTLHWNSHFPLLYFIWVGVLLQYVIYQLYHWEFFLLSLSTLLAGAMFYHFKNDHFWDHRTILLVLLSLAVQVCVIWIAFQAGKNSGSLHFGSRRIHLFSKRYNPLLHYMVAALWLVCIAATLILGGLFAYYCMFAAVAVEFIAAVYYTFQLN